MWGEDARHSCTRRIKVAALEQDMRPQQAAHSVHLTSDPGWFWQKRNTDCSFDSARALGRSGVEGGGPATDPQSGDGSGARRHPGERAASFITGTDIGEDNGYTAMGPDQVAAAIPLLMP